MSELLEPRSRATTTRHMLLANVSILALLGGGLLPASAANDSDRPTVWVELGGQLERVDGSQQAFAPPFFANQTPENSQLMTDAQRAPRYSVGGEGKITLVPRGTDWEFSVGVRYGRSNGGKHLHRQSPVPPVTQIKYSSESSYEFVRTPSKDILADAQTTLRESHVVLDFQAGKDVGLGLFGSGGKSIMSGGIRFAQFTSKSDVTLHARPVYGFVPFVIPGKYLLQDPFHNTYTAISHIERSTRAIGPSLSWDASASIAGDASNATFDLDWGINVAVLFGRQRTRTHHQTTGYFYERTGGVIVGGMQTSHYAHSADPERSRSVTIPNVGGFAGVSLKFPNAKVALGYRADFFFGAADGGIDTRKTYDRNFHGPFATLSIGLGG